jgi:NADH dehydrogenase
MIAVAGGTGRLGRLVVRGLLDAGHDVRVLSRRPEGASDLVAAGAEVVQADVRRRETLDRAVAGADVVVSAVHGMNPEDDGSPHTIDWLGNRNLIDAATAAGAVVVLMSIVDAAPDGPMELQREKWRAEEYLRASGTPWTVVRATAFAELWLDTLRSTANRSGRPMVFGRGDNPINFVPVADVAAAVVRAATDPTLRGRTITVAGSRNRTMNEMAAEAAGGRTPRHVPRPALRAMSLVGRPIKPAIARLAATALVMDTADLTRH